MITVELLYNPNVMFERIQPCHEKYRIMKNLDLKMILRLVTKSRSMKSGLDCHKNQANLCLHLKFRCQITRLFFSSLLQGPDVVFFPPSSSGLFSASVDAYLKTNSPSCSVS